jgi:tetratricopeptide (TPR) repeat protein
MHHLKDQKIAYVLWFFFGIFGIHRYYLSQNKTAFAMLILTIAIVLSRYWPLAALLSLWWFIDALLIPGYVDAAADHSMVQLVDDPKAEKSKAVALSAVKFSDVQQLHVLNKQYMESFEHGHLDDAITSATEALSICETQLGLENGHAAAIRNHLGEFYRRSGNLPQAINMYKSAIAIQEKFPDKDISPEQAQDSLCHSLNSLAGIYTTLGQTQDAKKLYRSIIETLSTNESNKNVPAAHRTSQYYVSYANALNHLAMLHSEKGQAEQAQSFFTEATAMLDHFPIESTELKVEIINNNATNESALLHYERAEMLFHRSIKILEDYAISIENTSIDSVENESDTLLASNTDELNIVYDEQYHPHVDEEKLREAAIQRNELQMAACHNGLGIVYANQNRLDDAEKELIAASKIRKNILPQNDVELITGLSHLSLVYFKQQKLEKAEAISKHILAARELAHGSDHADTKLAESNLALIQAEMLKRS